MRIIDINISISFLSLCDYIILSYYIGIIAFIVYIKNYNVFIRNINNASNIFECSNKNKIVMNIFYIY